MKERILLVVLLLVPGFTNSLAWAQGDPANSQSSSPSAPAPSPAEPQAGTTVPHLVRFNGVVTDPSGKPAQGVLAATFSLYELQEGGSPLWAETQNIQLDDQGRYSVLLGATLPEGLPLDLFTTGKARWLGVQPQLPGAGEQPRVLLVGMPYALKASDADTLGGKPPSAYVLSQDQEGSTSGSATGGTTAVPGRSAQTQKGGAENTMQNAGSSVAVGGSGTPHFLPIWTTSNTLGNSVMFQTDGKVGVGTTTPGAKLDSTGAGLAVRGTSHGAGGTGVFGNATARSGYTIGVYGQNASTDGAGVFGNAAGSAVGVGVLGLCSSPTCNGAVGIATSSVSGSLSHGVVGQSASPNGGGVLGSSTATSGGVGVDGEAANPNGSGVVGQNSATTGGSGVVGVASAPSGFGVIGYNNAMSGGVGVAGVPNATSGFPVGVYGQTSGGGYAVWGAYGFSATSLSGVGVKGSIEAGAPSGIAGQFYNVPGQGLILQGISGYSNQVFSVDANGNVDISGSLTVGGSKSAKVRLQDGREVALYAVGSPENWFEDFGTAQLNGGTAEVAIEPAFLQTVDTAADYHVFLTPKGDCHGLYVARTTPAGFEVRELGGGSASIAFDYRIVARRRGFETVRLQEVHVPQGPKDMPARLASMRSHEQVALPPPPPVPAAQPRKITIPSLPPASQQ